jgi:hypothetical protein
VSGGPDLSGVAHWQVLATVAAVPGDREGPASVLFFGVTALGPDLAADKAARMLGMLGMPPGEGDEVTLTPIIPPGLRSGQA